MKKLLFILIVCCSLNGFGQLEPKIEETFNIDKNYEQKHFTDLIITHTKKKNDGHTYNDTIYSCDYSKKGMVYSERNSRNGNRIDGTYLFKYNSKGQEVERIFYEDLKNRIGQNTNVKVSVIYYNSFDSIAKIDTYNYQDSSYTIDKRVNDSTISMSFHSSGIYSWKISQERIWHYNNNKSPNKIDIYIDGELNGKTEYKYDSLNRLKYYGYCQFMFNDAYSKDTNSCQIAQEVHHYYNENTKIEVDTYYFGASMTVTTLTKKYNDLGLLESKKKKVVRHDRHKNNEKDGEWLIETNYYFDENNRIVKRVEINKDKFTDKKDSQTFNYFYNN